MRPLLLLLALAPLGLAQRTMTWNPVHNTVRYEFRLYNPSDRPARDVVVHLPLPQRDARQEIRYLHLSRAGLQEELTDVHGQRHARYAFAEIPPNGFVEASVVAGATLRNVRWIDPGQPERPGGPMLTEVERARYLAAAEYYSMESDLLRETAARLVEGARSDLEKVERIHDFVISEVRYILDGRWDTAEQVLKQGHGSCSEYNYLLSGLCRLAGLPTRYVGGSSRRPGALPVTDVVFHRWTEVFLEGVGWFPVDASRNANPVRGKRSHFGTIYSDMLVWCRQAGGRDDLLGWDYRAMARWAEDGPSLRANHRTRWFAYVRPEEIERGRRWLADGAGSIPSPDVLECALLDWQQASPRARRRLVEVLAREGRSESLRRAAGLTDAEGVALDLFDALCADQELAQTLRELAARPHRLRAWFRREEPNLVPSGKGSFRLQEVGKSASASVKGPQGPIWIEMARDVLADLGARLRACSPGPVVLAPVADQTAGEGRDFRELDTRILAELSRGLGRTVLDGEELARHMQEYGPGKGEFWGLLFPESALPEAALPEALRPVLVIVPVARIEPVDDNPSQRRLVFELRVLDLLNGDFFTCGETRLYRHEAHADAR